MLETNPVLLPTPPYVAFSTFWAFIQEMHTHGSPPHIFDANAFGPTRSGATRSQLLIALRFLGLIDESRRPTADLHSLVLTPDAERLRHIIGYRYRDVATLDLQIATTSQLDAALMGMGVSEAMLRKTRTFFIHAAKQAGIDMGPQLATRARSPRQPNQFSSLSQRARGKPSTAEVEETADRTHAGRLTLHPFIQGLLVELPVTGRWTKVQRDRWIDMARLAVDMLYEVEEVT